MLNNLTHWTRRLSAVSLFFVFTAFKLTAQCDLVISEVQINDDCMNYSFPVASMAWSGGTAPFSISVMSGSGILTQGTSGFPSWYGILEVGEWDYEANVTVTDAMGCSANYQAFWVNHIPMPPQVILSNSCTTGTTLRWSGMYSTGTLTAEYSMCQGPFTYYLYSEAIGGSVSGEVSSDWMQEAGTTWRFASELPAGNYLISIFPSNSLGPVSSCNTGSMVQCFVHAMFNVPTDPGDCGTNFNLRAALAGALPSGSLMDDQLRVAGVIPTEEPYTALGYSYVGSFPGAALQPTLLTITGNNAVVDWVVVELRDPLDPAVVLYSRPALIQRDGDVVGLNGSTYINTPLPPGNYHVALRHRNHLGIMTASPRSLVLDPTTTIDLRLSSTTTYGTAARVAVGSVHCLWPGDAGFDGSIRYTGSNNDRDPILQAVGGVTPTNVENNVYSPLDVNMDGSIRYTGSNNDRDIILQSIGGVVPTAIRTQQIP